MPVGSGTSLHEEVPDDAVHRAASQKCVEEQILALASSLVTSDASWFMSTVIRPLITSHPSGAQATAPLLRLLTLRNTLSPISRLPAELLASIFSHIIDSAPTTVANQELVRASAVCTHWRGVALSFARLWTRIDLQHSELAALAFARSQNAPLHVILALPPDHERADDRGALGARLLQPLHAHAARIALLILKMPADAYDVLLGAFPPALPLLSTLIMRNVDENDAAFVADAPGPPEDRLRRPTSIAHTAAPALRLLRLENLSIPWTAALYRGLRVLHVEDASLRTAPSLHAFRDALAACPGLEHLILRNAGPTAASRAHDTRALPPPAPAPVPLPRLLRLSLVYLGTSPRRDVARTTLVLSQLAVPRTALVELTPFAPTEAVQRGLLARFDTLRVGCDRLAFSAGDGAAGALVVMLLRQTEDHAQLPPLLGLAGIRTAVVEVRGLGRGLPRLLRMLEMAQLETLRTVGLPPAAVEKLLGKARIEGKGLRRLEVVVGAPQSLSDAEDEGLRDGLRKFAAEVEVRFM